jgi:phosphatidylinositol phospholipase C delta
MYDSDTEPMIFHSKTKPNTGSCTPSLSPLRSTALPFQDLIAGVMHEVFGDRLVSAPLGERQKIDRLPSPEELKGRILLEVKNLYVGMEKKDGTV